MAGGGNGVDLGHVVAMLTNLLQGQQDLRADVSQVKGDLREVKQVVNEHTITLAQHGRRLDDLSGQLSSVRDAGTSYRSSVLGHGVWITELDARVRRIEQHLNLPPAA